MVFNMKLPSTQWLILIWIYFKSCLFFFFVIQGSIRDSTGTFNGSFLYTGGCTFLSAAAMTIAHFYEKKRNKNLQNRHDIIEIVADEP